MTTKPIQFGTTFVTRQGPDLEPGEIEKVKRSIDAMSPSSLSRLTAKSLEELGVPRRHHAAILYFLLARKYPGLVPSEMAGSISEGLAKVCHGPALHPAGLDAFLARFDAGRSQLGLAEAELSQIVFTRVHIPDTGQPPSLLDDPPLLHPEEPGALDHPEYTVTSLGFEIPAGATGAQPEQLSLCQLSGGAPDSWCYLAARDDDAGLDGEARPRAKKKWVPLGSMPFAELLRFERAIARAARDAPLAAGGEVSAALQALHADVTTLLGRERTSLERALAGLSGEGRVSDPKAMIFLAEQVVALT